MSVLSCDLTFPRNFKDSDGTIGGGTLLRASSKDADCLSNNAARRPRGAPTGRKRRAPSGAPDNRTTTDQVCHTRPLPQGLRESTRVEEVASGHDMTVYDAPSSLGERWSAQESSGFSRGEWSTSELCARRINWTLGRDTNLACDFPGRHEAGNRCARDHTLDKGQDHPSLSRVPRSSMRRFDAWRGFAD